MAKFVIAGAADCPYYAKVELLADTLERNLQSFMLHKIVINPDEWKTWLSQLCEERGWDHNKSPIVWRELVDRGGKGVLIGGANEFQEYANGYYDIKSLLTSDDLKIIAAENKATKQEIDAEEQEVKKLRKPVKVCITNGTGDVCYHLAESFASGKILGPSVEVDLVLHEYARTKSLIDLYSAEHGDTFLDGVVMELTDLACPLVTTITPTANARLAFANCCTIVLLDEVDQEEDETTPSWLHRVHSRFVEYARIINEVAPPNVKVIVGGGGPINFIVSMMIENAPLIRRQNIVGCAQMVECQAKGVLSETLTINSAGVVDLTVWGSVNRSIYVDTTRAKLHGFDGAVWGPNWFAVSANETTRNDKWLETEYQELVKSRTAATRTQTGHPLPAVAAASAVATTLKYWWNGSPEGETFSLAVLSEGWFDVPEGLVFSCPVMFTSKGYWTVCQDIDLSEESKAKLQIIVQELKEEREVIYPPPVQKSESLFGTLSVEGTEGSKSDVEGGEGGEGEDDDKFNLGKIEEDREGEEQAQVKLSGSKEGAQSGEEVVDGESKEEDGEGAVEEGEGAEEAGEGGGDQGDVEPGDESVEKADE